MIKPLIYNSDIKALKNKSKVSFEELELINHESLTESKIQGACKKIFYNWINEKGLDGLFVQIDNGGKAGIAQKIKKKFEGTISGMTDVMLLVSNNCKAIEYFLEFKRVGTPASIKPKDNQLEIIERLNKMGYNAEVINNTVYFKEIVLNKLNEYFDN